MFALRISASSAAFINYFFKINLFFLLIYAMNRVVRFCICFPSKRGEKTQPYFMIVLVDAQCFSTFSVV